MKRAFLLLFSAVAGITGCSQPSSIQTDPLDGAWRLVTMQLILADGDPVAVTARESLFIFADGYYSIGYAFGDERPETYAERWRPNEAEKAARFSSMIVNAGSYQISGSQIKAKPLFALAPAFVGGDAEFFFKFAGDTLELTWERSVAFDGLEYPSAGTVTFLQLVRAD